MNKNNEINNEFQGKLQNQFSNGLDPVLIFSLIIKNWYFILIGFILAFIGARFYLDHTMPVFRSSVTILIETGERQMATNDELLQGLGLPGGLRNMDNQIKVLKSRDLTKRVLDELPYEIDYFYRTVKNQISIYPVIPIKIIENNKGILPRDTEFSLSYLGNQRFNLKSESDYFILNTQGSFGDTIKIPGGSFHIECINEEWFNANKDRKLFFLIYSQIKLINYYNSRLDVEMLSQGGSILSISLEGTNRSMDVDFLNKLTEVFQSISLDKKNAEATRRIQFIDDQIVGISDSLLTTENKLQQFRSANMVMDLSAQGQAIIGQLTLLENERARLSLEANYYDYLADYLDKEVSKEVPIVPITMGITDAGLAKLVADLADLQTQVLNSGGGVMNPMQSILSQRVRSTKEALHETLNGLRRANSLARSENEEQINKVKKQATVLPITERQLLGIERKFKLNDELYTFLLETRANLQMQKASNTADSEVIDPANEYFSYVVSPDSVKIYFLAFFAGLGIPLAIIFLVFLFNKKLSYEDLRKITAFPVVGNIPHNIEKSMTVVFDYPGSAIAESFRLLRSRMQFFTKDSKAPVILITSSLPEEGKTFTAINLASVYSLLGKKTILIGFDLRKPKIFQDFKLKNENGISTWLIGKDSLQDIIQETSFENLSIISAGPVPPNPSELTSLDRSDELVKLLKEKYDYIIVDSSPIGLVSDTLHLTSLADACLLVVRPKKTLRDMLELTLREIGTSNIKGACMVINDIQTNGKYSSYGYKYGYTNDSDRSRRFVFFRKNTKNTESKIN